MLCLQGFLDCSSMNRLSSSKRSRVASRNPPTFPVGMQAKHQQRLQGNLRGDHLELLRTECHKDIFIFLDCKACKLVADTRGQLFHIYQ